MGTNYYWKPMTATEPCPHCGHTPKTYDAIHIGKSSAGWCFALCTYPTRDNTGGYEIRDLGDWQKLWEQPGVIEDEYGGVYTAAQMLTIITERGEVRPPRPDFDYARNHAVPGPNNLARHALDGFCVRHGEGTYDYVVGDFS